MSCLEVQTTAFLAGSFLGLLAGYVTFRGRLLDYRRDQAFLRAEIEQLKTSPRVVAVCPSCMQQLVPRRKT